MSRIPFENIWISYNGAHEIAQCPICQKIIHKDDHQGTLFSWNRGHIISIAKGGPDFIINLLPICESCNCDMKDDDLFTYLSKINKIEPIQSNILRNQHLQTIKDYDQQCSAIIREGTRCTRRKCVIFYDTCWVHMGPTADMEIDKKI